MGNFIKTIKSQVNQPNEGMKNNSLLNLSQAKLREYHGSFKSVCDTFSIDKDEFLQIFGSSDEIFHLWDTDKNLLIDALELFSGLILYSDAKFEEKIRFLFDLFDFNELNSLSLVDLEFMLISCCNATYKIYGLSDEVNEEDICHFLASHYDDDSRINISQMLKWCYKIQEVDQFFEAIQKKIFKTDKQQQVRQEARTCYEQDQEMSSVSVGHCGEIMANKQYTQKLDWISLLCQRIYVTPQSKQESQKDIGVKMNWVYGFRCQDVKKSLIYLDDVQKMVYFTACICIVYSPTLNQQEHYLLHQHQVISITNSASKQLIATGELAPHPAIHIWNVHTMQNLGVIKGQHKRGVHLLNFFHSDKYLATCGIRSDSPVLVYNLQDFSLLLSTYVDGLAIDLFGISNHIGINDFTQNHFDQYKQLNDTNIICTYSTIHFIEYKRRHFETKTIRIFEHDVFSKIKCGLAYRSNTNPNLQCNDQDSSVKVITGHKKGQVVIWEDGEFKEVKQDFKSEIMNILNTGDMIVIATVQIYIYFYELDLGNQIRQVDLTNCSVKLFNFYIGDLLVTQQDLLVCTTEGDLVRLSLAAVKNDQDNNMDIKATRNNFITKLTGKLKALSFLEKNQDDRILYVAGENSKVYAFAFDNHELIDIWSVGEDITAMDSHTFENGSTHFAVGCHNGKLFMRQDWEEYPSNYDCEQRIHDIKFQSDGNTLIVLSEVGIAYIFKFNDNSFFKINPEKIRFENNEIPISVTFTEDNQSFIIGTSMKNQYKFDQIDNKSKNILEENEVIQCSIWNVYYPAKGQHHNKKDQSYLPAIIGGEIKLFIGADRHGYVYFFKDREQLAQQCGGFLQGHASPVSRLAMTKEQDLFYSLGLSDNTLIEWKVEPVQQELRRKAEAYLEDDSHSLAFQNDLLFYYDECLYRELKFCGSETMQDYFKDSFVQFKGTTKQLLTSLVNDMEDMQEIKDSLNERQRRPPPLSLHLDHVFGFQCFDQRNTVQYLHKYSLFKDRNGKTPTNIPAYMKKPLKKGQETSRPALMLRGLQQDTHDNCQRDFLYFAGRVLVILDPLIKSQRFYEGHKKKVTCFAIHPQKVIVASGEASQSPQIHIWNQKNCEQLKILKTYHHNGIIKMEFSRDGELLVSIGMDRYFSVQVTNWKTEDVQCFRNQGQEPIFDIKFNPYDSQELVSSGFQNLTFWRVNYRSILREKVVRVNIKGTNNNAAVITAFQFLASQFTHHLQCDLVTGNNFGDLAIVSKGLYISVVYQAHSKQVNCIRLLQVNYHKMLIITAGEDDTINIWDAQFQNLHKINLKKHVPLFEKLHINIKTVSPQSLDLFMCHNTPDSREQVPVILVGTRNGEIFEMFMKVNYDKKEDLPRRNSTDGDNNYLSESSSEDEDQFDLIMKDKKEKLNLETIKDFRFEYSLHLSSHCAQQMNKTNQSNQKNKKLFISLHPVEPVMVSVGEDKSLILWDIEQNKEIVREYLDIIPTCCKFSPDGDQLVVGFIDGQFKIFDSKIQRNALNSVEQRFKKPLFELLQHEKNDKNTAILNIEFSPKGKAFAVSFDNSRQQKDQFDTKLERESSYIAIYNNQTSKHNVQGNLKLDRKQYKKDQYEIKVPSLEDTINTDNNQYSKAVYHMTFDSKEQYLMLYYQNIDNMQVRQNYDLKGDYVMWDLETSTQIKIMDKVKNCKWNRVNFPNSIFGQYQFARQSLEDKKEFSKDELENTLKISAILDVAHFQDLSGLTEAETKQLNEKYLVMGSELGDIHLARLAALYSDNEVTNQNEYAKDQDMCLAKSYPAHASFVSQIELLRLQGHNNQCYLLTTAVGDECVMKWKMTIEDLLQDKDYKNYNTEEHDQFSEIKPADKFKNETENILTLRKEIDEAKGRTDESTPPEKELVLQNIIGRKAFNSRNNLFYDYDGRVIYIAGANLVITDFRVKDIDNYSQSNQERDEQLNQHFLSIDQEDPHTSQPEISCIALSQDKKYLAAGTNQLQCKLILWDICSKSCLKNIPLRDCIFVTHIRFGYDNRQVVILAVTEDYKQVLYLIDTKNSQVLGQAKFWYSSVFRYRDIEFFPQSINKMCLVGNRVIQVWNYKGGNLTYYNVTLPASKARPAQSPSHQKQAQEEEEEDLLQFTAQDEITFMAVIFVPELDCLVAGGDDGDLYICDEHTVMKRKTAHENGYVFCLASSSNGQQFVSGGSDGSVLLWQLSRDAQNEIKVEKLHEYCLLGKPVRGVAESKDHIQSLCVSHSHVLCGTKAGDVYELVLKQDNDYLTNVVAQDMILLKMNAHDGDHVIAICFSYNCLKLFTITRNGHLCIWDLCTLSRVYQNDFNRTTINMIVCKNTHKIYIAFKDEVIVLKNEVNYPVHNGQRISRLAIKDQIDITDMKLSSNGRMLALALGSDKHQKPRIQVHDVENDENAFKLICFIDNILNHIEYIDISKDNYFLMFKDAMEEVVYMNLDSFKKENYIAIEYDVEWLGDGIKFSDQTRGIEQFYSIENQSLKVVKLSNNTMAVTDEMGTIRLFNYPYENQTHTFMRCYTNHLNYITQAVLSTHEKTLVTYSMNDRCMLLWRIEDTEGKQHPIKDIDEYDN